ncbi:hypothetical protein MY4038_007551 [Beauveria bassiana]
MALYYAKKFLKVEKPLVMSLRSTNQLLIYSQLGKAAAQVYKLKVLLLIDNDVDWLAIAPKEAKVMQICHRFLNLVCPLLSGIEVNIARVDAVQSRA